MKMIKLLPLLLLAGWLTNCGTNNDLEESEIDPEETVEMSPDYEDSDQDNDGDVEYEEASARSEVTTQTTNYADRSDSLNAARDTLVDPTYTDDEYEQAFSTSTTNPDNQVEGGVTPKDN